MISFLYIRVFSWIYRRAFKVSAALVHRSIYWRLRKADDSGSRESSIAAASEIYEQVALTESLLATDSEVTPNRIVEIKEHADDCEAVRFALGYFYALQHFIHTWIESEESLEKAQRVEELLCEIGWNDRIYTVSDVLEATETMKKKLSSLSNELGTIAADESREAVYAVLFPRRMDLSEVLTLSSVVSFFYLIGTYVFTIVVFRGVGSQVVGLTTGDYVAFATSHTWASLLLVAFGIWFVLPEKFKRAQQEYLSRDIGVKPKRFTYFDVAIWLMLVTLHIPLIQYLLGQREDGWHGVILIDAFILLMLLVREIPYERIFHSWYAVQIAVITGLILVFMMATSGWSFSMKLKEPTEKDWVYEFEGSAVSSSEYSLVFQGAEAVVFYRRASGAIVVFNAELLKSFRGKT